MAGGLISSEKIGFFDNKSIDTYVRHRSILYIDKVRDSIQGVRS